MLKLSQLTPKKLAKDATKRELSKMPRVHLYGAGPPCQGVSIAGKKRGLDACHEGLKEYLHYFYSFTCLSY